MRRSSAVVALAAAAVLLGAAAQPAGAAAPFDLRRIEVSGYPSVTLVVQSAPDAASSARPVVTENGRPITGLELERLSQSKAIVLAIDRSQSMSGRPLRRASAAAELFLANKRHADRVGVVTFGSEALKQSPLSQATIDASTTLRTLSTDRVQGTALYDAVVVSASELGRQARTGRVIVVLTDGQDVRSLASLDDALRAARDANVVIHAIALGRAQAAPLRRLARGTGGTFHVSPTPDGLEAVFRRVSSAIEHTWRVSYLTAARPGETVTLGLGGGGGSQTVVLPGKSTAGGESWLPSALTRGAGGVVLLVLAVALLFLLAVRQWQRVPRAARIRRLVQAHTDPHGGKGEPKPRRRPTFAAVTAELDRRLRSVRRWERVERLTEKAAVPVSAATVVVGAASLAVLLATLAGVAGAAGLFVLVSFLAGLLGPFLVLEVIGRRRVRAFETQLPEVLATIASSLRVGHGLKGAFQAIADEGAPPTSIEFRRVLAEARLGRPLEEALVSMCERLGSEDLLYVASAVEVQSQVGGSLAGVFGTVADTVRQRQHHRGKVRALTASGRASAFVLSIFPVAMVILLVLVNPDYMLPFLRSDTGQICIAYSVVSIAVGAFFLNRVVNVKE